MTLVEIQNSLEISKIPKEDYFYNLQHYIVMVQPSFHKWLRTRDLVKAEPKDKAF